MHYTRKRDYLGRLVRPFGVGTFSSGGGDQAHITYNVVNATVGILTLYGNTSTGPTNVYGWSVSGPTGGVTVYTFQGNFFDPTWNDENPTTSTLTDPAPLALDGASDVSPFGGYAATLTKGTSTDHLYLRFNGGGSLTVSRSQGPAITGDVTATAVGVSPVGNGVTVTGIVSPTGADLSVVYLLDGGGNFFDVQTTVSGDMTFASLDPDTYTVKAFGGGIGRNGTNATLGTVVVWTPRDMENLVASLPVAIARASLRLWQDAAKTIPAVANGDPVRKAVCPYTLIEFTAPSDAARPTLTSEGSGKWSLVFDGVNDQLVIDLSAILTGSAASYLAMRLIFGAGMSDLAQYVTDADDNKSFYGFTGPTGTGIYEAFGTTTRRGDLNGALTSLLVARSWEVQATSASWKAWLDGTQKGNFGSNTMPDWDATATIGTDGTGNFFAGKIACIILADEDATGNGDQAKVRTFLGGLL